MNRLIPVFILIILLSSCRKSESDFLWEKSYGKGKALFVKTSPDSGFAACGEVGGKPYFMRLDKKKNLIIDFTAETPGLFSSAWFDTTAYITGGNTGGKMLLMSYDPHGNKLWEKSIDAGFKLDYTNILYTGNGSFLAVGTANPDSSVSGVPGLLFVRFNTKGFIIAEKKITTASFIAVNEPASSIEAVSAIDAVVDNAGNIYLAVSRKIAGSKTRAGVAKFNDQFQKLWLTEIFNNIGFASASLAIKLDGSANVYVAGKTELSSAGGTVNNSFLASYTCNTGSPGWKKYFENSNIGSSLLLNDAGELMMLNKNCFIINKVYPADGADAGRIRMFGLCNSSNTDAFGADFDMSYDKNIIVAGSRGGNFYLALKSSQ